jgi:monofunctional biosynthetic peptidoglycan transglycosylase
VPAVAFSCVVYAWLTLPDVRPLKTTNPSMTAFMQLRADEARAAGKKPAHVQRWVPYRQIAQSLTRAVLVSEDAAFWQHEGVDYDELQKSIELDWGRWQLVRGASTITQQLAKNLYLSPSRNPLRKFRELIIARRLEAELNKRRILELYLNIIEWGDGIYGIEAAAQTYYHRPASTLDRNQSAMLAGAIINPRAMNPGKPTPRLYRREQIILKRMGEASPPPPEASDRQESRPESAPPDNGPADRGIPTDAPGPPGLTSSAAEPAAPRDDNR